MREFIAGFFTGTLITILLILLEPKQKSNVEIIEELVERLEKLDDKNNQIRKEK